MVRVSLRIALGLAVPVHLQQIADEIIEGGDVRFWHLADIHPRGVNVRFRG
jgi:hypothetical protein